MDTLTQQVRSQRMSKPMYGFLYETQHEVVHAHARNHDEPCMEGPKLPQGVTGGSLQ